MASLVFIFLLALGHDVAVGLVREYIFVSSSLPWSEAQTYCRENYKDLATITTLEENSRLKQSGSGYFGWIGMNRTSGTWTWSDGTRVSFQNWYQGYPSNYECAYVNFYFDQGAWFGSNCAYGYTFYCYRFLILVKENKTWDEAQRYCRAHYTGLASVTSVESLKQVNLEAAETQTESVWTGLRFMNRRWSWVSREQLGSLISMPSCPAPSYHCGALNTMTNTVNNQNCNQKLNFICYWV